VRDIDSRKAIAGATVLGPVLGVWLSLLAIEHAKTGIAATLMAMVPVFILPLARYVRHEQVSPRAVLGAVIAVAGVAVLVLR
jgi:drug/metabolite transporter (DMT)-like permease